MLVTAFTWSGTLPFWRENVVDGMVCHAFGEYIHQELVEAGHQGDGPKLKLLGSLIFLWVKIVVADFQ